MNESMAEGRENALASAVAIGYSLEPAADGGSTLEFRIRGTSSYLRSAILFEASASSGLIFFEISPKPRSTLQKRMIQILISNVVQE